MRTWKALGFTLVFAVPAQMPLAAWSGWWFAHAELNFVGVAGWLLSQGLVGGILAMFEASRNMATLQRHAGHDLNDSLARGSYFSSTHPQLQPPLEAMLGGIGVTDAANPLPPLPPTLAGRRAGARRLPAPMGCQLRAMEPTSESPIVEATNALERPHSLLSFNNLRLSIR